MKEKAYKISIKNWHINDRPREKLVNKGKDVLSEAELLAIVIGSGSKEESAVELAKKMLQSVDNNLTSLARLSINQLTQFKGIGEAKAVAISSCLELGRRYRSERVIDKIKIESSNAAFSILEPIIGPLSHEEFWVLYLNNSHKVIKSVQLSKGGITGTLVDIRLVLKAALELGATAIILAHNHPSGTLKPSKSDKDLTTKLRIACESIDIKVLDHLIIAEKAYFSFADQQLL